LSNEIAPVPSHSALGPLEHSLIASITGSALALFAGTLAAYRFARFRAGGRRFPLLIFPRRQSRGIAG
jgi:ABC-type glycerol-3-phosphate transport system permease component